MKLTKYLERAEAIITQRLKFESVILKTNRVKVDGSYVSFANFEFMYNGNRLAETRSVQYDCAHDARILIEELRTEVFRISVSGKPKDTDILLEK
jgi:hypothetical protein